MKIWRPNRATAVFWQRFHYSVAFIWLLLIVPSLLWWSNSLLWVIFMSLWANVASHWGAAQAAKAEVTAEK